jgi:transposase
MPQPYSDDLRRKLLEAYEAGQGSLRELAQQFRVSWGYSKKIRVQQLRSGRKERTQQKRHGPEGRVTPQVQQHLRSAVRQQPDLTLAELQQRIQRNTGVELGRSWLWVWLQRLGLRHKKNRSAHRNKRPPRTSGGGRRGGNW